MKKILFFLFILFITITSCKKKVLHNENLETIDYSNIDFKDSINLTKEFNFKSIILETNPSCIIGHINKIIYKNNRLYILDICRSKSVFVFDIKGKFLFKISPQGGSGKECLNLTDFDIYKKNIILLSAMDKKLLFFDLNGNFNKKLTLKRYGNSSLKFISDSLFVTTDLGDGKRITTFWNLKGDIVKSSKVKYAPNNIYFYPIKPLTISNNFIYANFSFNDTIYKIAQEKCSPAILFDFGSKHFPTSKFKTANKLYKEYFEKHKYSTIYDFAMTNNYFFADIKKAENIYFTMYNRKTHKSKVSSKAYYKEYVLNGIDGDIKNGFISQISSNHIEYINKNKHGTLFQNLRITDNPVVVLVTEKDKTRTLDSHKLKE